MTRIREHAGSFGVPLTAFELLVVMRPDRTFMFSSVTGIVVATIISFRYGAPFVIAVLPFWVLSMWAVISILQVYDDKLRERRVGRFAGWWLARNHSSNFVRFRKHLVLNPVCPEGVLVRAAPETSDVLLHPRTPKSVLIDAVDQGRDVDKVLRNPNVDGELVERCISSSLQLCRLALAQWEGCPSDVLLRLCSDDSERVAHSAARHPNCPRRGRVLVAVQYPTED